MENPEEAHHSAHTSLEDGIVQIRRFNDARDRVRNTKTRQELREARQAVDQAYQAIEKAHARTKQLKMR